MFDYIVTHLGQIAEVGSQVIGVAAVIAAALPVPSKAQHALSSARGILDAVACNFGHATNAATAGTAAMYTAAQVAEQFGAPPALTEQARDVVETAAVAVGAPGFAPVPTAAAPADQGAATTSRQSAG
jgi:hypothetical protein